MFRSGDNRAVVLAGGGHAHLYAIERAAHFAERGCEVVLVNPSPYLYYSGMATGVISGTYTPEQDRIDVRRLVERGGGRFVRGRVTSIDRKVRKLILEGGEQVSYDLASFCLGSEVAPVGAGYSGGPVVPVKPVENMVEIRTRLLSRAGTGGPKLLVIGGGAAGCEVAANAANLLGARGVGGRVTLAEAGPSLLYDSPAKARSSIFSYLRSVGVRVLLKTSIVSRANGVVRTGAGQEIAADIVVPAAGVVPRSIIWNPSVLTGEDGGLWVNPYLQSVTDPRLFGGGDSIAFRGEALPRLGVFGIRQGPLIFRNLLSALEGKPLEAYAPQRRYLYVLNLGDGTGLAIYGSFSWRGRSAMRLKHYIDQRFVRRYSS
ncbi:MAG: FAD-dependent oxidoreductase [Rubrobacteraceae bacterium]